jgi:hypothetical protein
MRGTKLLFCLGLTGLAAGVPVSTAVGDHGDSLLDVSVSLGKSGSTVSTKLSGSDDGKGSTESKQKGDSSGSSGSGDDKGDKKNAKGHDAPTDDQARPKRLPRRARPVYGRAVGVVAVAGQVRVKLPGGHGFVALGDASRLPNGSVVDSRAGVVQLTSARPGGSTQTAAFSGAAFAVHQPASSGGLTDLVLRGDAPGSCAPHGASRAFASAASRTRRLWGSGHGRFRTRGRYGAASVRGTVWLTEDRCDGTLVRVHRGRVAVRDLVRHRTTYVRAGHSRFVRAPR